MQMKNAFVEPVADYTIQGTHCVQPNLPLHIVFEQHQHVGYAAFLSTKLDFCVGLYGEEITKSENIMQVQCRYGKLNPRTEIRVLNMERFQQTLGELRFDYRISECVDRNIKIANESQLFEIFYTYCGINMGNVTEKTDHPLYNPPLITVSLVSVYYLGWVVGLRRMN